MRGDPVVPSPTTPDARGGGTGGSAGGAPGSGGSGGSGSGGSSGTGGAAGAPGTGGGSGGARDGGADAPGGGGSGGTSPDAAADQVSDGAAGDAGASCPAAAPEITTSPNTITPCSIAHLSIGQCGYPSTVEPGCFDYFECECISSQPGVECRWRLATRGCPGAMATCNPLSGAGTQCPSNPSLECLGCPAGGDRVVYYCTTACTADSQCTDPARPTCNRRGADGGSDQMSEGSAPVEILA